MLGARGWLLFAVHSHTGIVDDGVGGFLRSRRRRLEAEDVGLPAPVGRRRAAGLRREDVAALANVSVDYYTRLEQGRTSGVSDVVLDAVARALRLDFVESEHLKHLARPPHGLAEPPLPSDVYGNLLAAMTGVPALVLNPALDLIASNDSAELLFGISARSIPRPNIARLAFTDSEPRRRTRNATASAAAAVAQLRYQAAGRPDDARLAEVVAQLAADSAEFRALWQQHRVRDGARLVLEFSHPDVGEMRLTNTWLADPTRPDLMLVLYAAEPDSASAERLARLLAPEASARMRSTSDAAIMPRSTAAL